MKKLESTKRLEWVIIGLELYVWPPEPYDSESDIYGDDSPDRYIRVLIHNEALFHLYAWTDMEEITIDKVPQAIVDLLTFLND